MRLAPSAGYSYWVYWDSSGSVQTVLAAPVPALPAVGLARLQGVAAHEVHELGGAAVARVHDLRLTVAVALDEDGGVSVGIDAAGDLRRDDVGRLIPADALVLADAAVLGVALAVRVPVHALQRVGNAVLGIDAVLVGQLQRRDGGLRAALELLAARVKRPRVEVVDLVGVKHAQGPDAGDLAVDDVDGTGVGSAAEGAQARRHVDGLVLGLAH